MRNLKGRILQACIKHQKTIATTARGAMEEHQKLANEYGLPRDRYDAFRNQLLRRRDFYAAQYQRTIDEIKVLDLIDPDKKSHKVEFGAIVITPDHKLFVSVGLGKIIIDEVEYLAISTKVPIYQAIKGLTIGEEFAFSKKEYKILDIL